MSSQSRKQNLNSLKLIIIGVVTFLVVGAVVAGAIAIWAGVK